MNLQDMRLEFFLSPRGEISEMYIRVQKRMYFEGQQARNLKGWLKADGDALSHHRRSHRLAIREKPWNAETCFNGKFHGSGLDSLLSLVMMIISTEPKPRRMD
jgi:hypothetical protein